MLRETLLGKRGIPPILEQLQTLAAARITLHTQVVLCPDINDGPQLERTVSDLAALHPAVQSLAIVPLGLTRHRRGLPQLQPVDSDYARAFIETWGPKAQSVNRHLKTPFLFLADEFYLKGGLPFPPLKEYGDLPQIENGVGLVPLFLRDAGRTVKSARPVGDFRVTVATGVSSFPFVADFLGELGQKTGIDLYPVSRGKPPLRRKRHRQRPGIRGRYRRCAEGCGDRPGAAGPGCDAERRGRDVSG